MRLRRLGRATAVLVAVLMAVGSVATIAPAAPAGADTVIDSTYGTAGVRVEPVTTTELASTHDASGRILLLVEEFSGFPHLRVYRYLSDGSPDPTFGTNGLVVLPGEGYQTRAHIAVQRSGRILVEAVPNQSPGGTVVRALTASGALDPTWGTDGSVIVQAGGNESAMVVRQDDSVALGSDTLVEGTELPVLQAAVTLLDPNGQVDHSFGAAGVAKSPVVEPFVGLAVQGNNLLLATSHPRPPAPASTTIARVDAQGTFDPSFGEGGAAYVEMQPSIAVHPDGSFVAVSGMDQPYAVRFSANGTRVSPPSLPVAVPGSYSPVPIGLDPAGRLVTANNYASRLVLSRLNTDLSYDSTFGPGWGPVMFGIRAETFNLPVLPVGVYPSSDGRTIVVGIIDNQPAIVRTITAPPGLGSSPIGSIDTVTTGLGTLNIAGWALDPDTAAPIDVHVYIDNTGTALNANTNRSDVGGAFPGYGPNHGFSTTISAPPGTHTVCAYAINAGAGNNSLLGCRQITVPSGSPIGSIDTVTTGLGTLNIAGWALDPDTAAPIDVHVYIDNTGTALNANTNRSDVGGAFPGYGPNHGFSTTISAPPGTHTVCAYAINAGAGNNSLLGCRQITVPSGSPIGSIDTVTTGLGTLNIAGWALDPDTAAPIDVHVYIDNTGTALNANTNRSDVGGAFPGYGPNHGFSTTISAPPGTHTVCAYAINAGAGNNSLLGCRQITVPSGSPIGSIDTVTTGLGTLNIAGWALDPDTAAPIDVHVYIDNTGTALNANTNRSDVGGAFPGYGPNHGFSTTISAPPGTHTVCAYAINAGAGNNSLLGCRQITVPSGSPIGSIDTVTTGLGTLNIAGWALDPDTAAPIDVHVYIDNTGTALNANTNRSDVGGAFPGYGPNHGFSTTISAPPGTHTVCAYAINAGAGNNSLLGCRQITVP